VLTVTPRGRRSIVGSRLESIALPRPLLDSRRPPAQGVERVADAARRRLARLRYRGNEVECPCCGQRFGSFAPDWNRAAAICPGCGAHERHRALALYLRERTELGTKPARLLHFAPEHALDQVLSSMPHLERVTADLEPGAADLQIDITHIALADSSFDAILCSHVLEHVDDDRRAMSELHRVLRPGGWALILVPLDLNREATLEDPTVTTPEQRVAAYWQADHVRLYALDIADRLREAGFDVRTERLSHDLPAEVVRRHGLVRSDVIFRCSRPHGPPGTRTQI
jgi:SAM-dependent methyltransferase